MTQANPSDEITPEVFSHLVDLAELELDPDEAEYLRAQLNGQLKAIREMVAIRLDEEAPITSHGVPYADAIRPGLRPDEALPFLDPQAILDQAPETESGYLVVPDIPHTELE